MTALALTPQAASASVVLSITGAPAGAVTLTRTDDNGSRPVRLLLGQEPISGVMTVTDYEPALTGSLTYEARDSAGAIVTATTTLAGQVTKPQLSVAVLPQYRYAVTAVTGYESDRPTGSTVHEIIGRDDALVTTGTLRLRRGQLSMWAENHTTARAIEAVTQSGEVVFFRQVDHPGLDLYFVAESVSVTPERQLTAAGYRWTVTVRYIEQNVPDSPLLGAFGWTLETLAAYGTLSQVKADFATLADVAVGP